MAYSIGQSGVTDYANTTLSTVTRVVADGGVGGSGEVVVGGGPTGPSLTISTNIQNAVVDVSTLAGYVPGLSTITITIDPNVYVYGAPVTIFTPTSQANLLQQLTSQLAALQIIGATSGDKINIVNNGNIVGQGGDGGRAFRFNTAFNSYDLYPPSPGNAAISTTYPINSIVNNGYIAGGGGGGGGDTTVPTGAVGGGGGAGGGISISSSLYSLTRPVPPNAGGNGTIISTSVGCCCITSFDYYGGGGGGYVLPGTTASIGAISSGTIYYVGVGGGAGASGALRNTAALNATATNNGGAGGVNGGTYIQATSGSGGGGGGWGANGAAAYAGNSISQAGAVGGNSIITNGNAVAAPTGSGAIYGTTNTTARAVVYKFTTSAQAVSFILDDIPGYAPGVDVIIIIPSGIVLYGDPDTSAPALNLYYADIPNSVRLIVDGAIMGYGGKGGGDNTVGTIGGDAIKIGGSGLPFSAPLIIDCTNGYVLAGGGGGGRGYNGASYAASTAVLYGGGGAGFNGASGPPSTFAYNPGVETPTLGVRGNNGYSVVNGAVTYVSGGSGGTEVPGTTTSLGSSTILANTNYVGLGGSGGGTGSVRTVSSATFASNSGGGGRSNGNVVTTIMSGGGGGGGWAANGGSGRRVGSSTQLQAGRAGGKAVYLNTWQPPIYVINANNIYGTITN